jgi:hypothetical protein
VKETLNKVKSMLNMKSALLKALQKDLEDALIKIDQRDAKIDALKYELQCYIKANQNLRSALHNEELEGERLAEQYFRQQFENEDLQIKLERATKDAEWWREQDEDEDYQASLEVAALDDIPLEEGEDKEEDDFVWPNSSMQVEPD